MRKEYEGRTCQCNRITVRRRCRRVTFDRRCVNDGRGSSRTPLAPPLDIENTFPSSMIYLNPTGEIHRC